MHPSSLKRSSLTVALTVACAVAFSACGQRRPTKGLLSESQIVADQEFPSADSVDEEPEVSQSPLPFPRPSPPSPPIWTPFPPAPKPSAKPTPKLTPKPKPSPKPTPKPTTVWPTGPTSPTIDLLSLFTREFSQAVGVYTSGKLEKPDLLPASGEGFKKIFQFRNRGHGTLDLISLVVAASKEVHREYPAAERVQIGDITDIDGGRQGGHLSHQNGLDADIVFFRKDRREMDAGAQSKATTTGYDEQFVVKGRVTPNFDIEANWKFIQLLVAAKSIDRIFVDRNIKQTFCEYAVAKGMRSEWQETLRKLRHEDNHADHMHVRIKCPEKSTKCRMLGEIPAGDGCDRLLDVPMERTAEILRMDGTLSAPKSEDTGDGFGC